MIRICGSSWREWFRRKTRRRKREDAPGKVVPCPGVVFHVGCPFIEVPESSVLCPDGMVTVVGLKGFAYICALMEEPAGFV
jgi:hypothetical protein